MWKFGNWLISTLLVGGSFAQELDAEGSAAQLDRVLEQARTEAGLASLAPVSDEVFIRRAYLEIVGRVPALEECRSFLSSDESGRRSALIDELLASSGHGSRMFNFWADLLRIKSQLSPRVSGAPYIHWLKGAILEGKPYDEIVRALITAEGAAQARGNGATGFYLRDYEMPEDNMAASVGAFLGAQIQCAQCHDDPSGQWTRKQFFELRAFTGGLRYLGTIRHLPNFDLTLKLYTEYAQPGSEHRLRAMRELYHLSMVGVFGSGTALARLPANYQYEDGQPGDWLLAQPPYGKQVELDVQLPPEPMKRGAGSKAVASRAVLADWLASADNEPFTESIVNRLWERAFGWALPASSSGSTRELASKLGALMVECAYDLDEFLRVLYRTQVWQAEAVLEPVATPGLHGPRLRRMEAEQVWDSLLGMIRADLDETLRDDGSQAAERVYKRYEELTLSSEEQIRERVEEVLVKLTGRDELNRLVTEKRREREAARRSLLRENQHLFTQFERARRDGDVMERERVLGELTALGIGPRANGVEWQPLRASVLSAPAPDGHFLRRFGQSDREQINGASTESTIPQALALINGVVEEHLVRNEDAVLIAQIAAATSPESKIEAGFLAILGREPTPRELSSWRPGFDLDSRNAVRDLVWCLVNSAEFLFVR